MSGQTVADLGTWDRIGKSHRTVRAVLIYVTFCTKSASSKTGPSGGNGGPPGGCCKGVRILIPGLPHFSGAATTGLTVVCNCSILLRKCSARYVFVSRNSKSLYRYSATSLLAITSTVPLTLSSRPFTTFLTLISHFFPLTVNGISATSKM